MPLTATEIASLSSALVAAGYSPTEKEYEWAMEAFGEMSDELTLTERELVLTLAHDFKRYSFLQYPALMNAVLQRIPQSDLDWCDAVSVVPLAETDKRGRPKSSSALLYPSAHFLRSSVLLGTTKVVTAYDRLDEAAKRNPPTQKTLYVLVDDFLGSGSSAEGQLLRLSALTPGHDKRILCCVLVAQVSGLERVDNLHVACLASIIRTRGISDSGLLSDKPSALATMDSLEARLGVEDDYKRGWKESEALVRMIRTPNNTFPVYWLPANKRTTAWRAPFPR